MINVTKTYLPPLNEYTAYLQKIWETGWITNQGPMLLELEKAIKDFLQIKNLQITTNGTIALQIAIKALDLKGEIITTPFSYVATANSIVWENCIPVFVDIEEKTFCIDANKIEAAITPKTSAILGTHVYGFPCDYKKIDRIALKHNLKTIYDGAHAFGVKVDGESIFNFGDISTISFHATKIFHTIEGGAVITADNELNKKIKLYKTFGHEGDNYYSVGINGKTSEFNAVMGLCNLPLVNEHIQKRKIIAELYKKLLASTSIKFPEIPSNIVYNYAYFPVLFQSEEELLKMKKRLFENKINTRRYFYPSLNTLSFLRKVSCPISEDISKRVLCLPLYPQLEHTDVERIAQILLKK